MSLSKPKIAFQLAYPQSQGIYNEVITSAKDALQKKNKPGSSTVIAYHLEWCTQQLNKFSKARQSGIYEKASKSDLDVLEQELKNLITSLTNIKNEYQQSGVPIPVFNFSKTQLCNGQSDFLARAEDCWSVATEEELDNIEKEIVQRAAGEK